jgi:hypothetical protein
MLQDVVGHEAQGRFLINNLDHHTMVLHIYSSEDLKPTITPIESHMRLYFDEIGQIFFCPTKWNVVSYVDLQPTQLLWKQVKAHQLEIVNYCLKISNANGTH